MEKIKELIELIKFEYGDCNCDSEKKCSYCKIMDELKEWKEAARSEAEEVNRLQAENKKLREALEFYANCTRLMLDVKDLPIDPIIGEPMFFSKSIMDNGDRAKEALKEIPIE